MKRSRCAECGYAFETAVVLTNAVCLACLIAEHDGGDFAGTQPTTTRTLRPLATELPESGTYSIMPQHRAR